MVKWLEFLVGLPIVIVVGALITMLPFRAKNEKGMRSS